jgi:ubiquinone/menaquinone biosynthesis C-methylase UbiE
MSQEKVWDEIAPYWDSYKKKPFGDDDKGNLFEGFIEKGDKKVLDLGCGSGRNFFKFNGVIYGVDFSSKMLKFAEKNAKELKIKVILKKSSVDKLPFEDNFFDKALYISALHCVENDKIRKKSIEELYRVLKPKGKALITVWNKKSKRWRNNPKEKMVSWSLSSKMKKVMRYYYLYDYEELKGILENAGFKVVWKNFTDVARNIILVVEK